MKRSGYISAGIIILAMSAWGCALTGQPVSDGEAPPEPEEDVALVETTVPATEAPPTETPEPPLNVDLVVAGDEEIVFDWTTDRCEDFDIPDLPARAYRDAAGQVYLLAPHLDARPLVGPDLNSVTRRCDVIMSDTANGDPAMWTDAEWLSNVYTEDGTTFYGIIHNEYHGWEHGRCSAPEGEHFDCWYNGLTLAISTDGARTFQHALPPPAHYIASMPVPYEDGTGPYGIYGGSNIMEKDGYYYSFVKAQRQTTLEQWTCLIRTPDLSDPTAWRFWDGDGFDGTFADPYASEIANPDDHICPPFAIDEIGAQLIESLTYNTEIERYVLVGISADQIGGREVWGFYFSLSEDLIEWTHRKLIMEIELPWTWQPGDGPNFHLYPSLIDPDSESLTFHTTDNQAYLYFTRFYPEVFHLDRDLIRAPVEFVVSP